MGQSEERLRDIIARDPYNVFPNQIGHSLSYGEMRDWNNFQEWMSKTVQGFLPQESGVYKGHYGTGQNQVEAEVKSVSDPHFPERGLIQIVIGKGELVQTTFTLTENGLIEETLLPGEQEPVSEIIRGEEAGKRLNRIKVNLHR